MGAFSIIVDEDKGFYKKRNLNLDEVNYLFHRNYKEYSFFSILSNKKERYMLKPRHSESPQHFFLVRDIADYLKKFTDKIQIFATIKPDIVFEMNNKKFAIEVETGKIYKKDKKKLAEKVKALNKNYGRNWFFVVTNKKFFSDYAKFGKTYTKYSIENKIFRLSKNKAGSPK